MKVKMCLEFTVDVPSDDDDIIDGVFHDSVESFISTLESNCIVVQDREWVSQSCGGWVKVG